MHVSQAGSRVSCRGVVEEGLPAGGRVEHCAVCACMYMYVCTCFATCTLMYM